MKKIVINGCYGGYSLSKAAYEALCIEWDDFGHAFEEQRDSPKLVEVVEKLGALASGSCAKLYIVEIPDDVDWQLEEYDGIEHVAEAHRTWS